MKVKAYVTAIGIKGKQVSEQFPKITLEPASFSVTLHPVSGLKGISLDGLPQDDKLFKKCLAAFENREILNLEISLYQ